MAYEYKRVLLNSCSTSKTKRHGSYGQLTNPNITDSVEELFNSMGEEGWILKTAVNLDSGADTGAQGPINIIEYIFYREKP